MSDKLWVALLVTWILSMIFGASLGGQKNAGLSGLALGLFFGPLGVIAAGLLDSRPCCRRCGGHQNVKPCGKQYKVCEHCGADNPAPRPQRPMAASVNLPPDLCTTPAENDPQWECSLTEAKRQL